MNLSEALKEIQSIPKFYLRVDMPQQTASNVVLSIKKGSCTPLKTSRFLLRFGFNYDHLNGVVDRIS